ncbi:MAG: hypothetical protein PF517_18795 [Salinivirgaceae bacterium]|jgi:hypothetical protein|nr:hypothetical protein [Salinivirgaceae bacterium]
MEIKGTAVKSIPEYVKQNHTSEYVNWMRALSTESQQIANGVSSATWYSMKDAAIEPSKKVGELFFNNDLKKGAWELGRFSAEIALHGVYKLYVKFSSPGHIISRASRIFSAYYRPSKMETSGQKSNSVKLVMTQFDYPSDVIEYRIAGWIERALEISGCKGIKVEIPESFTKGDTRTVYECSWS